MKIATHALGSYAHELALSRFGDQDVVVLDDPTEVIRAIADNQAELGLVPFFNLYAGTEGVPVPYRLLLEGNVFVHDIISRPIPLCLAAVQGIELGEVERVFLMKVLRQQCDRFLDSGLPNLKQIIDDGDIRNTPAAMQRARDGGLGAAAIGPVGAARSTGLEILAESIENPNNTTYFFLIAGSAGPGTGRGLACVEVTGTYSEEEVVKVLPDVLSLRDYIVYDVWLEDKAMSKETNHLVILEVDPPDGGIRDALVKARSVFSCA